MQRIIVSAMLACAVAFAPTGFASDKIVILHTNDTHSQLMPDDKGRGGIARRKVLVDSVRAVNPATILVDSKRRSARHCIFHPVQRQHRK